MAACPIISTSRGGALVTFGLVTFACLHLLITILLFRRSNRNWPSLAACALVVLFTIGALGLGLKLGWKTLAPRMTELGAGAEQREEMYANARPMAKDYPIFGTGAGTFATVFQLYRASPDTYWPAQLHNDWLETRITFGYAGSALIALALGCVLVRWFYPGGIHKGRRFVGLAWLALAGCLVHARYDFPLQVYSVLFLFLLICAMLTVLSRRTRG
jgi:O-antigen ligase